MIERVCWLLLAALHAMPALAAVRPSLLGKLYGVDGGGVVALLLQHRGALFLAVLILCIVAAFDPASRRVAVVVVAVSMVSFLMIYAVNGQPAPLRTIAIADLVGLVPLAWVAWRACA